MLEAKDWSFWSGYKDFNIKMNLAAKYGKNRKLYHSPYCHPNPCIPDTCQDEDDWLEDRSTVEPGFLRKCKVILRAISVAISS
ncbi:uncharacterized protein TrAFT101_011750 [Trichoderma asperellum]|uniref:uncharacterized protein n=1 Tax=Trichoderma asperellum TaxID=101201 RepID=UPI0033256487|nr:hypothetical protein TrAFT101_011750 [Trichoderma asperellum]